MKNSNKKAIAMALMISAVISPVGKEVFASEPNSAGIIEEQNDTTSEGAQGTPDPVDTVTSGDEISLHKPEGSEAPSTGTQSGTANPDLGLTSSSFGEEGVSDPGVQRNIEEEPTGGNGVNTLASGVEITEISNPKNNKKYTFMPNVTNGYEYINLKAVNPADGTDVIEIIPGKNNDVPEGYVIQGELKVLSNNLATSFGNSQYLSPDKMEREIVQNEDGSYSAIYKVKDLVMPNRRIDFYGASLTEFNIVEYQLYGGTWTDTETRGLLKTEGEGYKQVYIVADDTVRRPSDPTKQGYEFLGWSGTSKLDYNKDSNKQTENKFTRQNLYNFDEVDRLPAVGVVRGDIVKLNAEWSKLEEIPYNTEYRDTDELYDFESRTVQQGKNGLKYKDGNGNYVTKVNAINEIIEKGTKKSYDLTPMTPAEELKEIPYESKTEFSDELLEGETKVKQKGENGEGFVDKDGNVVEYTKKPVDEIILVGTRKHQPWTDIEDTAEELVDVDFKPIYRESKDLKKGEIKVIQPGVKGKAFVDKDGNIIEYVKKPVDEIILIGTGEVDEPENPSNIVPTLPNVEDPNTDNKDKPEVPSTEETVTPEKPEESKTPDKPGKPENTGKPNTSEKVDDTDDTEGSKDQGNSDSEDDGDKVKVPTPDKTDGSDEKTTGAIKKDDNDEKGTKSRVDKESDDNVGVPSNVVKSNNPKTGIGGSAAVLSTLGISLAGLVASKKKENDEEK